MLRIIRVFAGEAGLLGACSRFSDTLLVGLALACVAVAAPAAAHDLERTSVTITFARDGSFVVDVANDPSWLKLRLEPFQGNFIDRIVLFVDGREIRPTSVELVEGPLATHRLRGRMPVDARTLRWYYGLVIDPYPLVIRRADGRVAVEEIAGDAWSGTIDLAGQFQETRARDTIAIIVVMGLLIVPIAVRIAGARRARRTSLAK